jgi:hypothetical protein
MRENEAGEGLGGQSSGLPIQVPDQYMLWRQFGFRDGSYGNMTGAALFCRFKKPMKFYSC